MHIIIAPFGLREKIVEKSIALLENQILYGNKLFLRYEEIEKIKRNHEKSFLEILYFNKENIHNILYNLEKTIEIDDYQTKKISNLFYLDLLLAATPNIINYIFSSNSFEFLYEQLLSKKEGVIKVILAKLLIDMIESYEGFSDFAQEKNKKELKFMTKEFKKQIKEQIRNIFNNCENIIEQGIDKLYMDIILSIFKTENLTSYDEIYKTLDYLELEEITITENMFNEFSNFIKSEEKNKNNFFIETLEDLTNNKKINYYYIILKYFLKNPIYIYQFPFLLNTRQMIIDLIKNNLYTLVVIVNDLERTDLSLSEKLIYIITVITDSEYYVDKYYKMKESLEEILANNNLIYVFPLFEIITDDKIEKDKNKNELLLKRWQIYEKMIKEKKYKKIPKNILKKLLTFFGLEKNKNLLLKIFTQEEYESFINLEQSNSFKKEEECNENKESVYYKSNCDYVQKIEEPQIENEKEIELVEDTDKKEYLESSMVIQSYTIKNEEIRETEASTESISDNLNKIDFKMFKYSNKYKIIEYYKVIESGNDCEALFNYSKNLSKGHYITKTNTHKLTLYNSLFEKKLEIDLFATIKDICELKKDIKDETIKLMVCCKNKLSFITINLDEYKFKHSSFSKEKYITYSSFEQINDDYFVFGEKGGFKIFGEKKDNFKKIIEENFSGKVKITNNIYALISNKLLPKGKDQLIIYDFSTNKTLKVIEGYYFNFSVNSIYSIDTNKINSFNDNKKILLCSCRKKRKNGILVVNIDLENNEFIENFYETENFEPSCFCQISNISNNNSILNDISDENNIDIQETEYFIVGGFDPDKRMGSAQLYRLKHDKENNNIKIKYLLDIETEDKENDFKGFDMTITCITQSKITGNVLINCLDGNVFLFNPPNLECFLKK